jgi:hypothetical protein
MLVKEARSLGGPMMQLARQRGFEPIGVTITAGYWNRSKRPSRAAPSTLRS